MKVCYALVSGREKGGLSTEHGCRRGGSESGSLEQRVDPDSHDPYIFLHYRQGSEGSTPVNAIAALIFCRSSENGMTHRGGLGVRL